MSRRSYFNLITLNVVFLVCLPVFIISHSCSQVESEVYSSDIYVTLFLVLCLAGFSAVRLSYLSVQQHFRPMRLPFYAFVYIWLGLMPLYQILSSDVPRSEFLSHADYQHVMFVAALGLLAYEIGGLPIKKSRSMPKIPGSEIGFLSIFILSLFSIACVVVFGFVVNDPSVLFLTRDEFGTALSQGGGVMAKQVQSAFLRTPIYVAFLFVLWKLFNGGRKDRYVPMMVVLLPFFVVANFPLAISRTWLGTIAISITLVVFLAKRKRGWHYFSLALVLSLLTIYPLGTYLRSPDVSVRGDFYRSIVDAYTEGSFDVFAQIANSLHYYESTSTVVPMGYQLLGPLLFWVPRSLWEEKPIGSGMLVAEELGLAFTNVSAPLWAEGYLNFSYLGVFLFLWGWGRFSRYLEEGFRRCEGRVSLSALMCVFFSGFQLIVLRGDLITATVMAFPFVGVLMFMSFASHALRVKRARA